MSKTITLITGGLVTITLSIFLILGKIDLTTFGTLTSAILGVVYGFYQKVENKELLNTIFNLEDEKSINLNTIDRLKGNILDLSKAQYVVNNTSIVKPKKETKSKIK